jgi:hypothetical protein
VEIGTADTTVRDLNVDIILRPLLGLIFAPPHVALDRGLVLAEPSFEFV